MDDMDWMEPYWGKRDYKKQSQDKQVKREKESKTGPSSKNRSYGFEGEKENR